MALQDILDDVTAPLEVAVEADGLLRWKTLEFNGTSDYIPASVVCPAGSMSMEIVAELDAAAAGGNAMVNWRNGASAGLRLLYVGSGSVAAAAFAVRNDAGTVFEAVLTVAATAAYLGRRVRWSGVLDVPNLTAILYADGARVAAVAVTGTFNTVTANFAIGRLADSAASYWDGSLEGLRLWSTARTAAQVAEFAPLHAHLSGYEAGLAAHFPMREGIGNAVYDIAGGLIGTVTGAVWTERSRTFYFSTHNRATGAAETPASTSFLPYLLPHGGVGPLPQSLSEDALFGGQASEAGGSLVVVQPTPTAATDQLSRLHDYTFSGRDFRIKVGRVADAYSAFALYRTIVADKEPDVTLTGEGLRAEWQLSSSTARMLQEPITRKRYSGIPHCVRAMTTAGFASVTRIAAYDLTRYTITLRFRKVVAGNPANTVPLIRKWISSTDNNWLIRLLTTGAVDFANSSGGVALAVNLASSGTGYADGAWHTLVAAQDDTTDAYLGVDGAVVGRQVPTGTPSLTVAPIAIGVLNNSGDDIEWQEAVLYNRFIAPDEAFALAASRADSGDPGCIGLWRADDGSGAAVNDYSTNANDAAIAGVLNTDYSWQPSDLGEPELAGRPFAVAYGDVLNALAVPVDSVRERYRLSEHALETAPVVRSQGTALTGGGTDYTASDSNRMIQMVAQEGEPVTFDHAQTTPGLAYPTQVAYDLLTERTRITSAMISKRYISIQTLAPWRSGYYSGDDTTAAVALHEILGGSGLCYFDDENGDLYTDMLLPPMGYGPYGEPCYDFNGGTGSDVTFGTIGEIASGSFTLCGWVRTPMLDGSATGGSGRIYFPGRSDSSDNYALFFSNKSGLSTYVGLWGGAGTVLESPINPFEAFAWYFVAGVHDEGAATNRLYIAKRGRPLVQVASAAASAQFGSPGSLIVGGFQSEDADAWGALQHVQAWDTVKTLDQLKALMLTPPVGNEANLVAYIPLNEGSGAPVEVVTSTTGTVRNLNYDSQRWAPRLEVDLDANPEVTLREFRPAEPAAESIVRYARNRNVMSSAEIDSAVTQLTRWGLMREWKDVPLQSADARTRHKNSRRVILDSPLTERAGAYRLARTMANRLVSGLYVGVLSFPAGSSLARRACGLRLTDEIGLKVALPGGLAAWRSFRVVSVAPNPLTLSTEIGFWG